MYQRKQLSARKYERSPTNQERHRTRLERSPRSLQQELLTEDMSSYQSRKDKRSYRQSPAAERHNPDAKVEMVAMHSKLRSPAPLAVLTIAQNDAEMPIMEYVTQRKSPVNRSPSPSFLHLLRQNDDDIVPMSPQPIMQRRNDNQMNYRKSIAKQLSSMTSGIRSVAGDDQIIVSPQITCLMRDMSSKIRKILKRQGLVDTSNYSAPKLVLLQYEEQKAVETLLSSVPAELSSALATYNVSVTYNNQLNLAARRTNIVTQHWEAKDQNQKDTGCSPSDFKRQFIDPCYLDLMIGDSNSAIPFRILGLLDLAWYADTSLLQAMNSVKAVVGDAKEPELTAKYNKLNDAFRALQTLETSTSTTPNADTQCSSRSQIGCYTDINSKSAIKSTFPSIADKILSTFDLLQQNAQLLQSTTAGNSIKTSAVKMQRRVNADPISVLRAKLDLHAVRLGFLQNLNDASEITEFETETQRFDALRRPYEKRSVGDCAKQVNELNNFASTILNLKREAKKIVRNEAYWERQLAGVPTDRIMAAAEFIAS